MKYKPSLYDLNPQERKSLMQECGSALYTPGQIDTWAFRNLTFDLTEMNNLSNTLREKLSSEISIACGSVSERQISRDGTIKLLITFNRQNSVECVSIPHRKHLTFCISTMAGCPIGCLFCSSGLHGFQRNLTHGEMLTQYFLLSKENHCYPRNIVLMGMGEPLLNFDNTAEFLKLLNNKKLANIGGRRITVSTIGIPEGIKKLAKMKKQFELAFSLHHPSQRKREALVPAAKKYPLPEIIEALSYYNEKTGRLVTFEYCLIKGVNDSLNCAKRTAGLAKSIHAHVNLISFNPNTAPFSPPDKNTIYWFKSVLEKAGITVTIRKSRGNDIRGACGQLRQGN